jgi:hypothetical protein
MRGKNCIDSLKVMVIVGNLHTLSEVAGCILQLDVMALCNYTNTVLHIKNVNDAFHQVHGVI